MPHEPARAPVVFTLEPRTTAHAEELFEVLAEPALYRYLDESAPASVDALRSRLARSESRRSPDGSERWLNWVVRDDRNRPAGFVQATVRADGTALVAYLLGSAHQGRGLGQAALSRMLDLLAQAHAVDTFHAVIDRRNEPSVRLVRRVGFVAASAESTSSMQVSNTDAVWLLTRR